MAREVLSGNSRGDLPEFGKTSFSEAVEASGNEVLVSMWGLVEINQQHVNNLQRRLSEGTIRRNGEVVPLTSRQIVRRERHLRDLQMKVDADRSFIRRWLRNHPRQ